MHRPRIIALCGLKRSGKDTVADYICNQYGYEKQRLAQPLKDALKTLFMFTEDQLESDAKDIDDPFWKTSPRRVMQFVGTEMMQYSMQAILPHVGRRFWVERFFRDYNPASYIVVPDVRFLHESNSIRSKCADALVIRVVRPNGNPSGPGDGCCQHQSETEGENIDVDHVVVNDASKEQLYTRIDHILRSLPKV